MDFTAFEPALRSTSISSLHDELIKLGFEQTQVSYSAVIWRGDWNGAKVTFKAYPSALEQRTVQSYIRNGVGHPEKLFENLRIKTSRDEEKRLLAS